MAPFDDKTARLAARARFAYELAGLRLGLREAWLVVPLVMLSLGCSGPRLAALGTGALLLVATVVLVSIGGVAGRAVRPGLLAGGLCAALPFAMRLAHLCVLVGCRSLVQFCLAGGLLSGLFLGYAAARFPRDRLLFLAVSGTIAGVAGSLGCLLAGAAGVVGMAVGFLAASVPVFVLTHDRR